MKLLTKDSTVGWLRQRGLDSEELHRSPAEGWERHQFVLSADAGRRTAFARIVAPVAELETEVLIIFTEFGIWDSCANPYLFDLIRDPKDRLRPLDYREGHLCTASEFDRCEALYALGLYFFYGSILTYGRQGVQVHVDHDDLVSVFIKDGFVAEAKEFLNGLYKCKA